MICIAKKIDKKILSLVLDEEVISFEDYSMCKVPEIAYYEIGGDTVHINIYEFQHKMKEWLENRYNLQLWSIVASGGLGKIEIYDCAKLIETFNGDTEFEAVYKAVEWMCEKEGLL